MGLDCCQGVAGARRVVPAHVAIERRDDRTIADQHDRSDIPRKQYEVGDDGPHRITPPFANPAVTSACRVAQDACAEPGRARITMSRPGSNSTMFVDPIARSRRRTVFRCTAFPTAFATMKPNRDGPPPSRSTTCSTVIRPGTRPPRRTALANSLARVTLFVRGSIVRARRRNQAESSERPLRRRAPRIARPARVRMRSRKPCTFARRRLLGWKVLLLIAMSPKPGGRSQEE